MYVLEGKSEQPETEKEQEQECERDWTVRFEIGMEMINISGYDLTVDTAAYGQHEGLSGLGPCDQFALYTQ